MEGIPVIARGGLPGYVGGVLSARDQQLRLLIEATDDYAIYLLSPQGEVLTWNAGAQRAKQYTAEEIIGRHFSAFYTSEDLCADHPTEVLRLATERGTYAEEGLRVRKDGSRFWASVTVTALRDENGRLIGFGKVTHDLTERREAEEAMSALLAQQASVFRSLREGLLLFEVGRGDGLHLVMANESAREMFAITATLPALMGTPALPQYPLFDDEGAPIVYSDLPFVNTARTGQERHDVVWGRQVADQPIRWFNSSSQAVVDPDGEITAVVLSAVDITEEREAELELAKAHARFSALVAHSSDVICILGSEWVLTYASPAYEAIYGEAPDVRIGASIVDVFHPDDRPRFIRMMARLLHHPDQTQTVECRVLRPDLTVRHVEITAQNRLTDTAVRGIVTNSRDVTERVETATHLAYEAMHDSLTGLANRALLIDRTAHALARRAVRDRQIALLFIDLDHFKNINDSLGHAVGDRVLVVLAHRLRASLRPEDTVARLGGDEFVILAEDVPDERAAQIVAERAREAINEPIDIDGRSIRVSCSIGVTLADGSSPDALLQQADTALYRVKASGRGRWELYDLEMREGAQRRLEVEEIVRHAVGTPQVVVHYQPVVWLASRVTAGVEALVRIQCEDGGLLPPDDFIPVAEETGLIVPLGLQVLRSGCKQMAAWKRQQVAISKMAVNVAARQLRAPSLIADIKQALEDFELEPSDLLLELTESSLILADDATRSVVTELSRMGVALALDDFGTGMSSLSHLREFPIKVIKIDRSFVAGIETKPGDLELVKALVSMGRSLSVDVVAEGVETEAQAMMLTELGCPFAQGYFFSRPHAADDVTAYVTATR